MQQLSWRQENNRIGYSFAYKLFEDWIDWYGRQPLIGEDNWSDRVLKNSIVHAPRTAVSNFSDEMWQRNKLNGKEPPPKKYKQSFSNHSYIPPLYIAECLQRQ